MTWRRGLLAALTILALAVGELVGFADAGAAASGDGFCGRLRRDQQLLAASAPGGGKGAGRVLGELDRLARSAPRAIKREMGLLVGLARKVASADPKDPKAFADLFAAVFDPKLIAASTKVERYALDVCKVQLRPLGGGDGTSPSPSTPGTQPVGSGMDASAIRAYLTTLGNGSPGSSHVNGAGVSTGGSSGTEVEIDTDLGRDRPAYEAAFEICRATSTYVFERQHVTAASIAVHDRGQRTLVRRDGRDRSCAPEGSP
jgi:hypothetical protein